MALDMVIEPRNNRKSVSAENGLVSVIVDARRPGIRVRYTTNTRKARRLPGGVISHGSFDDGDVAWLVARWLAKQPISTLLSKNAGKLWFLSAKQSLCDGTASEDDLLHCTGQTSHAADGSSDPRNTAFRD
jgi:hypothetical protein